MNSFKSYTEARTYAGGVANRLKLSVGIEKMPDLFGNPGDIYMVRLLPRPENRSGWELRCEVVDPEK